MHIYQVDILFLGQRFRRHVNLGLILISDMHYGKALAWVFENHLAKSNEEQIVHSLSFHLCIPFSLYFLCVN